MLTAFWAWNPVLRISCAVVMRQIAPGEPEGGFRPRGFPSTYGGNSMAKNSRKPKKKPLTPKEAPRSQSGGTEAAQGWLAILTDPRNIQWLFALGGTFVVVGILIWLGSQRVFENPWVQGAALGAGTLSALIGGWLMFLFSRYRMGARALVILG